MATPEEIRAMESLTQIDYLREIAAQLSEIAICLKWMIGRELEQSDIN